MKRLNLSRKDNIKRTYFPSHAAPNGGMCPVCGSFGTTETSTTRGEFRTQYRKCQNGHRFQTVIKMRQSPN